MSTVGGKRTRRWVLILVLLCGGWASSSLSARAEEADSPFTDEDRQYWVFQPIADRVPPDVGDPSWCMTPIDRFILASLEKAGIAPARAADRRALIRRATFDLHGLPPTPEEIAAFVADGDPQAYEKLLDRLLASPRYGERWAQYWLDLVRYAETNGFKSDEHRPNAWRYRDYVIRSLNADKPYDRFVIEQLAGDELPDAGADAIVATGFLRHWPYESNQVDVRQQWENILSDVTDAAGQVFLGLTVGCARCHDHKYDPILQADYFRLQAFFAALAPGSDRSIASAEEEAGYRGSLAAWEQATAEVRAKIDELETPFRREKIAAQKGRFPAEIQALLDKPEAERTVLERQLVALASRQLEADGSVVDQMKGEVRKEWEAMQQALAEKSSLRPPEPPQALAISEIGAAAPAVTIPGETDEIAPGFLSIIDWRPAEVAPLAHSPRTTGRRSVLARWIVNPDNRLASRVMANRLWHYHFGRGICATPEDLGRQGEQPTHPELLDWLAKEFVRSGWSMKAMHRLIMTSAVYRQESLAQASEAALRGDPENKLFWRMRLRRLEGESLRDAMLVVSGELNEQMHGPSARPELPAGLGSSYAWEKDPRPEQDRRRSIYLLVKRNLRYPLFATFDAPDTFASCSRRACTTTAPQALALLNSRWVLDRAEALAGRVCREASGDEDRLTRAYLLTLGRAPGDDERTAFAPFLSASAENFAISSSAPAPDAPADGPSDGTAAKWIDLCHVLLNANEFLFID